MTTEISIYEKGNITITNQRAIFSGKTYAVSNITSVEAKTIQPSSCLEAAAFTLGGSMLIFALLNLSKNWQMLIVAAVIIAAAVAMHRSSKPHYAVSLTTASGEVQAYTSFDQQHIQQIIQALNTAITTPRT